MALSKLPVPAPYADDWTGFITVVEKQRLGFIALSLTNTDTEGLPAISQGSVIEISGSLYQAQTEQAIGGSAVQGLNYIRMAVSGDDASPSWTTIPPVWNPAKQGWYSADGAARYAGQAVYDGTAAYRDKIVYGMPKPIDAMLGDPEDAKLVVSRDAVSAGQPVGVKYDETYCKPQAKQLATTITTITSATKQNCAWIGGNYVLYLRSDGAAIKGRVAQFDETAESFSWVTGGTTLFTLGASGVTALRCAAFMSGYRFVVVASAVGVNTYVAVATFNGTDTITVDASASLGGVYFADVEALRTNGEFMVVYNNAGTVTARVGHESGGSITWDTSATTVESSMHTTAAVLASVMDTDINVAVAYQNTSSQARARIAKWDPVSPATISFSTAAILVSTETANGGVIPLAAGKSCCCVFIPTASDVKAARVEFLREGGYIRAVTIGNVPTGINTDGALSVVRMQGTDRVAMIVNDATTTNDFHLLALKYDGRGYRLLWDLTYEFSSIFPDVKSMKNYRNGCVVFVYNSGGTNGTLVMAQIPALEGIAKAAFSAGAAGMIKYGGKVKGLSGLTRGKVYGMDYYSGELGDNDAIPLARAISGTEELVIPIQ